MKSLTLLPLALLFASCFPSEPYPPRPPYRGPDPYGTADRGGVQTETGNFQPIPGGNPAPQPGPPVADTRAPNIPTIPINPDTPAPRPTPRTEYPVARSTNHPDQVISPYPPYRVISVEGIKKGALAKDPSTGEIFRVP